MTVLPFSLSGETNHLNPEHEVAGLIGRRLNAAAVSIQIATEAVNTDRAPMVNTDRYFMPTYQAGHLATQRTEAGAQTMAKVLEFKPEQAQTDPEEFLAEPSPDDVIAWEHYVKNLAKPSQELNDDIKKAA